VLAALYRNVSTFPDPKRAELQADLREYARQVIDVAWPLQHGEGNGRPIQRKCNVSNVDLSCCNPAG
jgi:hypothetical protein